MDTVSTAPIARPGPARTLLASTLVLAVLIMAVLLAPWSGTRGGPAEILHERARKAAALESAHEAALAAIKASEAYVRRHRRWPQSLAQAGHAPILPAAVASIEIDPAGAQVIAVRFAAGAPYLVHYKRMGDVDQFEGEWVCAAFSVPDYAMPPDCHQGVREIRLAGGAVQR